jgi:hypothetical protein
MIAKDKPRKSNTSLRERLNWIVDAARSGRYGEPLTRATGGWNTTTC